MLQILGHLLHVRPGTSVIGLRVQEIFTVCLQQRQQWPQVSKFFMKHMPAKVAQELTELQSPNTGHAIRRCGTPAFLHSSLAGVDQEDHKALSACQARRDAAMQQASAEFKAGAHGAEQAVLVAQAASRDSADLKAILLVSSLHSFLLNHDCLP